MGSWVGRYALAVALGLVLLGCVGWSDVRPIVLGPYTDRPNPTLFQQAVSAAASQGYQAQNVDPSRGTFTVAANTRIRFAAGSTFTVQCYREGWVRVVPGGAYVEANQDHYSVAGNLRQELESFAMRLQESLGPTAAVQAGG